MQTLQNLSNQIQANSPNLDRTELTQGLVTLKILTKSVNTVTAVSKNHEILTPGNPHGHTRKPSLCINEKATVMYLLRAIRKFWELITYEQRRPQTLDMDIALAPNNILYTTEREGRQITGMLYLGS